MTNMQKLNERWEFHKQELTEGSALMAAIYDVDEAVYHQICGTSMDTTYHAELIYDLLGYLGEVW